MMKPVLSDECGISASECRARGVARLTRCSVLGSRYTKGFTLFEFIVVIAIVAILAGMFLKRVPLRQEEAEKAAMESVAGAMQSALTLRFGTLVARGADNKKELDKLETDNPINWLQQKPKNYAGEFYAPTPGAVAPGNWMFDLQTRELVYVPDRNEYLTPGKDGIKWVRFRVQLGYEPKLGRPSEKELVTVLFEPSEPYRWFD